MFARLLSLVLAAATGADGEGEKTFPKPSGNAAQAAALLNDAKAKSDDDLRSAAEEAVDLLGKESPAGELLSEAVDGKELSSAVEKVVDMLSFKPKYEADLPKGFPTYTPVGAIEVKRYPENRRAEADDFFTLFRHITSNEIAMTAPVRMEMSREGDGKLEQKSMSFFYANDSIGEAGEEGQVTTIDDDGELMVAIGCRGEMKDEAIKEAQGRLERWLKVNPKYRQAGDLVVMGYNSPMVPKESNFFEVQLPVEEVKGE